MSPLRQERLHGISVTAVAIALAAVALAVGLAVAGAHLAGSPAKAANLDAGAMRPQPGVATRGDGTRSVRCRQMEFEVNVLGAPHTMSGTLCEPGTRRAQALVVLLHGFSYNRTYWDLPYRPDRYSALRKLAAAGNVTLALDWLGAGESDHPATAQLLPDVNTAALNQVAQQLEASPIGETRSGKVFLVGHSVGSALAIRAVAQYETFDGVVVTGFLHAKGSADLFAAMVHPTAADPAFADDPRPDGQMTTRPGTRRLFYYPFNAEERVVQLDEELKDALGFPASGFVEERDTGAYAGQVDVPVFVQVGAEDLGACTPPRCPQAASEQSAYPLSPALSVEVRDRVGHNINLHRDAPAATERIELWIERHGGR